MDDLVIQKLSIFDYIIVDSCFIKLPKYKKEV